MLFRSRYNGCQTGNNKLNIDHKILYYQNKFKQGVIDNFVDSYLKTPIPCVQCNQTVKFKDLFEVSKDLKADAMITGHYVKVLHQIIKQIQSTR